ncbi:hypothetical protein KDA82_32930, partial [Streptomyces daliensis]|nr:hypothetical protein [Streptomyces daliensis]
RRAWRRRSRHEQVEVTTRWLLVGYPWFMLIGCGTQLVTRTAPDSLPKALAWSVFGLGLVQCVVSTRLTPPCIERYA